MTTIVVTGAESMQRAIGDLRQMFAEHGFLKLTVKAGKARSIPQNAITHAWYGQIARELREDDELGWKCYCKLHHGVPILRAEDAEFRETYDGAIKGLSYEQKLAVMKILPVTSIMTKAQLSKYADAVRDDFRSDVRADKVLLEFPQDARWAA
jgi:hypothetical protein